MKLVFKVVCGIMLILFAASCIVQFNDPDPWLWVWAYGFAGVLTALAIAGRHTRLPWLAGAIYLAWALWNMPKRGGNWFNIEEGRESMGLMICAVWMIVLAAADYRARNAAPPPQN